LPRTISRERYGGLVTPKPAEFDCRFFSLPAYLDQIEFTCQYVNMKIRIHF